MSVEIVWQAYDEEQVGQAWSSQSIVDLYNLVLRDEYRRRVDPRSMLFHRTQQFILDDLSGLMKKGAVELSLEAYWTRVFALGYEELPLTTGELEFDYRLISYFTSLRMADDYNEVESIFDSLFHLKKGRENDGRWTFYDLEKIEELFKSLGEISIQDLVNFIDSEGQNRKLSIDSLSVLIQNYVDFYRYAKNNHLQPFFFNSASDIKKWGNLVQRKKQRSQRVVDLLYQKKTAVRPGQRRRLAQPKKGGPVQASGVMERLKQKRRKENFIRGLADTDPLVRQKAVEYLGERGDEEVLPQLLALLQDPQPEVRQEVVRALGEINSPQAVPPLVQVLKHEDNPAVVKSAAYSLRLLGQPEALPAMLQAATAGVVDLSCELAFFPGLAQQKQALKTIQDWLFIGEVGQRTSAAFILGRIPGSEVNKTLQKALDQPEVEVACAAAAALANRKVLGARKKLAELVKASQGDWRSELIFKDALGKLSAA